MSEQLLKLAEDLNLPALFCEQLAAGHRITMWSEELEFVRARIWAVYQDTPGKFSLELKFQGYTGSQADGWPLVPLPEDIAAARNSKDPNYWEIQGYVLVLAEDLEKDVLAAVENLLAWTQQKKADKAAGYDINHKECPNLFFKPANDDAGLQLLPKVSKGGDLSFGGWAYQHLEWRGNGIGATSAQLVSTDEHFANGRKRRGADVGAPVKRDIPEVPVVTPTVVTPEKPLTRRGRGGESPEVPPKVDPAVLAALV